MLFILLNFKSEHVDIIRINSLLVNIQISSGIYIKGSSQPNIIFVLSRCLSWVQHCKTPVNLVNLPVILDKIHSLETSFPDQNVAQLNFRGENLTIRFMIREI